jgi:hypothetical protein
LLTIFNFKYVEEVRWLATSSGLGRLRLLSQVVWQGLRSGGKDKVELRTIKLKHSYFLRIPLNHILFPNRIRKHPERSAIIPTCKEKDGVVHALPKHHVLKNSYR